ncbi:DNA polymerase IV [Micromonospora sp. NPDC005174]|uniref:DNA polymerase IV n=1 Tax=unclassified Micromonospora TaxID=2617518 RepID=UPI00339DF377
MGRSQSLPRGDDPRFGPDADDSASGILHVDMDAFFASVEVRARPELRGRAVVVGGVGPRGVVSSASYEARRYGVRSAMPTSRARALCPHAVYLPPNFAAYSAASRAVMQIFRDVTPLVEPLSLDEAFLDVTGARKLFGSPATIARLIRQRVADEQRLTCSVGVAPSKFVAKLGSTRAKPDGLLVVPAGQVLDFLHPLPVDALWGVGERAAETLRRLGLATVGDLAEAPVSMLRKAVGAASATHLHELASGRDPRRVSPEHVEKSIGAEVTFDADVADPVEIRRALLALSAKVGVRLRGAGQVGRTVTLKVRLADFRTVNRSRTLGVPTDTAREMFDTVWALYTALDPGERIRLVGVRVEGLTPAQGAPRQLTLGAPERGWREAEAAADAAAARFGRSVIGPASLLGDRDAHRKENPPHP